nr:hypothetical protein [Metallosphaera javensis (ex Hofmann et al. 2022)]
MFSTFVKGKVYVITPLLVVADTCILEEVGVVKQISPFDVTREMDPPSKVEN